MNSHIPVKSLSTRKISFLLINKVWAKSVYFISLFLITMIVFGNQSVAQGAFTALTNTAPAGNNGVMLLLSNGTVMCKSNAGGGDGYGNQWNLLTPDASGSYVNGTWTTLATMTKTRLYFASQVLQDGRVFVAGGEYGTGGNFFEIYDPVANTWSGEKNYGKNISDANSEILQNGKVMVTPVNDRPNTFIWNPADNTYVAGPQNLGNTNESAWVKLPDNSILFIQTSGTQSERYIPSSNTWVADGVVPVALYEPLGAETGAAFMLPDGRAFFLGGNSNTAYYTPTGNSSPGTWAQGPNIPANLSAPDAAAAMMVNGNILCAISPTLTCCDGSGRNIFNTPTSYYVFNYTTNTFTQVNAPAGGLTTNIPSYKTNMLDLPNGQVLYSEQGNSRYYVFTPTGSPLAAGKPSITDIAQHNDGTFTLTGTKLNGISEGAGYGDDWQMNSNYPIVRLTNGSNVYYARTYNWSSTGVSTGSTPITTEFALPAGLPPASYSLVVIANGIASDPVPFCTPHIDGVTSVTSNYNGRDVSCFNSSNGSATVTPIGATLPVYSWSTGATTQSISNLSPGTYNVTITNLLGLGCSATRSVTIRNTPQLTVAPTATSNFNGFNISCFGGTNGTAAANAAGGTPTYTYSWSNGQTTNTATGLSATNYSVQITDRNGCTVSGNVTLTQPTKLTTTAVPTSNYNGYNVRCHGGNDGTAEAFPAGGVAPYTYSWSNGQTTKIATGLSATTYTVTVTDANSCNVSKTTVALTEPPQLTISAGNNKTVYFGYPDSSCAQLTATNAGGGVPPYTLSWSNGSNASSINVCPTTTTVYTVTITDKNGCSFSSNVTVCVIDVRCGHKLNKVIISHKTGSIENPCVTLCLSLQGAKNHFLHHPDDELAACGTIKICIDGLPAITMLKANKQPIIEEVNEGNFFVQAFPNPSSVSTTIKFMIQEDDVAQLKVFNLSGQEMKNLYFGKLKGNILNQVILNSSALANGMYIIKLQTSHGKNFVGKIVISK